MQLLLLLSWDYSGILKNGGQRLPLLCGRLQLDKLHCCHMKSTNQTENRFFFVYRRKLWIQKRTFQILLIISWLLSFWMSLSLGCTSLFKQFLQKRLPLMIFWNLTSETKVLTLLTLAIFLTIRKWPQPYQLTSKTTHPHLQLFVSHCTYNVQLQKRAARSKYWEHYSKPLSVFL